MECRWLREDLTKYHGNHKHGDREVVDCEEITSTEPKASLSDLPLEF